MERPASRMKMRWLLIGLAAGIALAFLGLWVFTWHSARTMGRNLERLPGALRDLAQIGRLDLPRGSVVVMGRDTLADLQSVRSYGIENAAVDTARVYEGKWKRSETTTTLARDTTLLGVLENDGRDGGPVVIRLGKTDDLGPGRPAGVLLLEPVIYAYRVYETTRTSRR